MAKVENPEFEDGGKGEVAQCSHCPFDSAEDSRTCKRWWTREGATTRQTCPTAETYAEACKFAEEAAK